MVKISNSSSDVSAEPFFDVTSGQDPLGQSIAPEISADQFTHEQVPAIPVLSDVAMPQTSYIARIQSRSASQGAGEFEQLAKDLITIGGLKKAYIQGDLSFEGLQGVKEIIEVVTGKTIPEDDWPSSGSADSEARILSFLDGAERILRGRIVTFLSGLVNPQDAVGNFGLLNEFNIGGIHASYPHLLNELLTIDDSSKFLERAAVVADYAQAISVAAGLSSLLEHIRLTQKEVDKELHMNPLDAMKLVGTHPDPEWKTGPNPNDYLEVYDDWHPKKVKAKIAELERSIFEAQSLLARGMTDQATAKFYRIYESDEIKEITEVLEFNGKMLSCSDFKLRVSVVMISGAIASIASAYAGYGLVNILGTSRLASCGVRAGKLAVEAVTFTASSRLLNAAFMQDSLYDPEKSAGENAADFGLEVLSNAGMFFSIGIAMKAYQSSIMKGLQLVAARRLVNRGAIKVEEIMTPAAQKLIAQEAELSKLGQAAYGIGGFGFEVLAFQEYEWIKGTIAKELLEEDVDPEAAFSPEAIKDSVIFLGALRCGRFVTKPIGEHVNTKINEKIGAKFTPRLERISERVRKNVEIMNEVQAGRRTDVDANVIFSDMARLAGEKLQVMREMAAFGLCSPVDVALAEAEGSLIKNESERVKKLNAPDFPTVSRESEPALSLRSASRTQTEIESRGERLQREFLARMPSVDVLVDGFVRHFRGDTSVNVGRLFLWLNISRPTLADEVWQKVEKKLSRQIASRELQSAKYIFISVTREGGYARESTIYEWMLDDRMGDDFRVSNSSVYDVDAVLQGQVLMKGLKEGISAHGTNGHFGSFINIMIEGVLRRGGVGGLDTYNNPAESAGPHGPFYVIVDTRNYKSNGQEAYANTSGGDRAYPESAHLGYLVPNDAAKMSVADIVERARLGGMLTDAEASNIARKVITYEEFLKMDARSFKPDAPVTDPEKTPTREMSASELKLVL